jgi:hypothetical protein
LRGGVDLFRPSASERDECEHLRWVLTLDDAAGEANIFVRTRESLVSETHKTSPPYPDWGQALSVAREASLQLSARSPS